MYLLKYMDEYKDKSVEDLDADELQMLINAIELKVNSTIDQEMEITDPDEVARKIEEIAMKNSFGSMGFDFEPMDMDEDFESVIISAEKEVIMEKTLQSEEKPKTEFKIEIPKAEPVVITPPKAEPVVITPPKAEPVVVTPPKAEPVVVTPPKAEPVVVTPPKAEPVVVTPPKAEPVVVTPPEEKEVIGTSPVITKEKPSEEFDVNLVVNKAEEPKPVEETPIKENAVAKIGKKKVKEEIVDTDETDDFETDPKKNTYTIVGVVVFSLALIGIIAIIYSGIAFAIGYYNQNSSKEKFEKIIYPLVIIDTPEFESVTNLDPKTIITAGIWNFVMDDIDKTKYSVDDFGNMTVPAVDIEPYIRQIFGTEVGITHQILPDQDFYVPYDEQNKAYIIPAAPQVLPYAPKITQVKKENNIYTLQVGYVLPGPFWNVDENIKQNTVGKKMVYVLEKTADGSFIVKSVAIAKDNNQNTSVDTVSDTVSNPDTPVESTPESTPEVSSESVVG